MPSSICPGSFWNYDDIEQCHKQRYVEYYPLFFCLALALIYTSVAVVARLFRKPPITPVSLGEKVYHPVGAPDKDAEIIVRTRTIGDELRLGLEVVFNLAELAISYQVFGSLEVRQRYTFEPDVPTLVLAMLAYNSVLSVYRFAASRVLTPLVASPFMQQSYLYTLTVIIFGSDWYSQKMHPISPLVTSKMPLLCLLSLANWLLLFSAQIGDKAPQLYTSKGSIPSTEPDSSLLRIMTCNWCLQMIRSASRKPLEMEDVLDLREEDHMYRLLKESSKYPARWSFFWRLVVTLRKPIGLNLIFGCTASLLKLVPTIFIQRILEFLEKHNVPTSVAWLLVVFLGLSYLLSDVVTNQAFYQGRKLSVGVRALVIGNVYEKALFSRIAKEKKKKSDDDDSEQKDGEDVDDENLRDAAFDSSNTGAVINLMSVDAFKIAEFAAYLHDVPATPLLVFMSIFFLYRIIGWSAFVAVGAMVVMMPLNILLARRLNAVQDKLMTITDRRIEKTNELLEAIRIVKLYTWESRLSSKVLRIRDEELRLLKWRYIYRVGNGFLFFLMPILVVVSSFWCFVRYQSGTLTTSIAFTALSVFNLMRMPLNELAFIFTELSSSIVSFRRIQLYLSSDNTTKYEQLEQDGDRIGFKNASFTWGVPDNANGTDCNDNEAFRLRDISLKFTVEDLNVIVGATGSGKTSLLLALLGEMQKEKGHVYLPKGDRRTAAVDPVTGLTNTVAYCPQEAWLVNDTIKNNILFAQKYDKQRYERVISACELTRDLEILDRGDQTLIGDKGIALSGGQKQRVSLARAIYSNSRHLILDDCLSAVDSHTAEALYNNALCGPICQNRTIILVSHNIALTIGKAVMVTVVANGRVTAHGPPAEVSASGHLGDDELVSRNAQSAMASRTNSSTDLVTLNKAMQEQANPMGNPVEMSYPVEEAVQENAIEEEERATGSVPLQVYMNFLHELASVKGVLLVLLFAGLTSFTEYLESWWVRLWAHNATSDNHGPAAWFHAVKFAVNPHNANAHVFTSAVVGASDEETLRNLRYYSAGYAIIGLVSITVALIRELIVYYGGLKASRNIFRKLLLTVVHARTRFFDSTPSGRIVNRFSKDMEVIDQEISANLLWFLISVIDALQITAIVAWVTPMLIPAAVVIVYVFVLIGKVYLAAARELKRLESITRSPIFQQFGETLNGAVVIRAYEDTDRFISDNWKAVDQTHRPYFWLWVANRWLSFWCSVLSLFVCVMAATMIVASADYIDPGMAGISLSFSTYFGDSILWIVRMYAQCEVSMNSVERVHEYMELEQEAPGVISESRPPTKWPNKGDVNFRNLSLRYSDDLPMVIKNVTFDIPGGNKVGVVGRTGAGKSTIITALFRLLEPATGSIYIDGVDISTIGVHDLRNGLSIIPQEPTLFKGTLRSNLDLFGEYTDDQVFKALSAAHLVPKGTTAKSAQHKAQASASSTENTNLFFDLQHEVTEGGRNLSQGQRQLLCLARAILKEPRILLLDEATASIDYETDAIIQETIRQAFNNSTILTIAHRLRTIADYDLILVLEKGEVAQFGHPYDLLQDKEGIFYGMCAKSGELETLENLAKKSKHSSGDAPSVL